MRIRVVIVDDSDIARALLRTALEADGDIEVVGEARDGGEALDRIEALSPDLVTVDLSMPGMDGLDVIAHVMATYPLPILVLTSRISSDPAAPRDDAQVLEAIQRGALEVAPKPGPSKGPELRRKVRRLAALPVVRHVARTVRTRAAPPPATASVSGGSSRRHVVAIAASAGGPPALARVLGALPPALGACVLVVQHLPMGYAERFARELSERSALPVTCAEDRAEARHGSVLLAPDDRHLIVTSRARIATTDEPPVLGHRPSANVLFRSAARLLGPDAVGVVLTGMGTDGAEGLREMRARGAVTIAQDEHTSAVYGMPRAARDLGAAEQVLPLDRIAAAIADAVAGHGGVRGRRT